MNELSPISLHIPVIASSDASAPVTINPCNIGWRQIMCQETSSNRHTLQKYSSTAAFLILLIAFAACGATATPKLQIIVQQPGIYDARVTGSSIAISSLGAVHAVQNVHLIKETTAIPVRKPLRFGFRYMIAGGVLGDNVNLKLITKFPESGLLDPISGVRHFQNEYVTTRRVGVLTYREYQLDADWELGSRLIKPTIRERRRGRQRRGSFAPACHNGWRCAGSPLIC